MVSFAGKAKASKPGQAGIPTITSQASGQVGLSWTAPSFSGGAPITDYKIEYSSNSGSTWTEWNHTPSAATSATVTGLPDYLTYIFRVSAKNAVGFGASSGNSGGASQFNVASGGTESTISNYNGTGQTWKVHTFTGSGSVNISRSITTFRTLVVGGGGSGGTAAGGGGGGGKAVANDSSTISSGSVSVTVGGGGASSALGSIVSQPGGNAGSYAGYGGASNYAGGAPVYGGYAEGGGGGGGAGGVGGDGGGRAGDGGSGIQTTIRGTTEYFAGGGGGGSAGGREEGIGTHGGGRGGGGTDGDAQPGQAGTANTGGGGGGGGWHNGEGPGGGGGSGIVILAYRIA